MSSSGVSGKKDNLIKDVSRFKFKEPKLRETTLDRSVRCMTLNVKRQNVLKEFLVDEIQSIDLCVEKIYEIKRQLKMERQEFFRRPLTQARIKEKRKNDEHYDDFIKEYEEQESQLRDYERVFYTQKNQGGKQGAFGGANTSADAPTNSQANFGSSTNGIMIGSKEKEKQEKKKERKSMLMHGKLMQRDPTFRLYRMRIAEQEEEEIEAPSFKYKYLTKEQLQQQKMENLPKKHNIPEKYCKCCNQLVRRHYCPHDFCEKPCIRQEKEKRLRQQYLDKNGGVRKQKKPLYKASVLANDISMAKSALDDTFTLEQQQEQERIYQLRIQAHLQMQQENELKIQQFKLLNAESLVPKKKGRKPKQKNDSETVIATPSIASLSNFDASSRVENAFLLPHSAPGLHTVSSSQMEIEKPAKASKDIHAQLDQILKRKGSFNNNSNINNSTNLNSVQDHLEGGERREFTNKQDNMADEQSLLKQLEAQNNVSNILVGGSKIIYRNEDSSYESSSSGISSGSSSEDEEKIEEE